MPGPGAAERLRLPSLGTESGSTLQKEHRRVVVMGAAKVGKSNIISQFLYDKFTEKYRETIEELHRAEYTLPDGAALTLDILDTSGAFQFPAMRALSISSANAFILVYAVNDEASWDEIRRLRDLILETRDPRVPIVVVGNKIDLVGATGTMEIPALGATPGRRSSERCDRAVSHELAETTARLEWECGYVECSAKENTRIIDVFKELLLVSKVRYNLSPAVRRRRQSLPNYVGGGSSSGGSGGAAAKAKHMLKRHSCTVA